MASFDWNLWRVEPISPEGAIYEFQAALITKRAA